MKTLETCCRTIKLKEYFKDAVPTEEQVFKSTIHKNGLSTQEELECKMKNQKPFNNFAKDERIALQELIERDAIVIKIAN